MDFQQIDILNNLDVNDLYNDILEGDGQNSDVEILSYWFCSFSQYCAAYGTTVYSYVSDHPNDPGYAYCKYISNYCRYGASYRCYCY